jgi:soluble lytic murein transglycosylase-like protein
MRNGGNDFTLEFLILYALVFGFFVGRVSSDLSHQEKQPRVMYIDAVTTIDPPCVSLYNSIEKHASKYGIPRKYAFGIAHKETSYSGPNHIDYDPYRISSAGALGPMQIMLTTAEEINKTKISKSKLKNDIDYNVETSMKILRKLKDRYKDWKLAFGAYNTGRPCVNRYAKEVYAYNPKY